MTKEEILAKYTTKDFIPELGATKTVIEYSKAMQEYADQETERLKAELNEVKKQYSELCDVQKKLCEQNISLDSELTELKERHKKDVIEAIIDNLYEDGDDDVQQEINERIANKYYKQKFEK